MNKEFRLAKNNTINTIGAMSLSFLMLGLGHISCGKIKRGILLYILGYLMSFLALYICIQPITPFNIVVGAIIFASLYLFVIIDVIRVARNPKNTLKVKPLIGYLILGCIWIVSSQLISPLFGTIIRNNVAQVYRYPSKSMVPTILVGDHLLVNRQIYKHKKLTYGDIIVFPFPSKELPTKDCVRRIIALGGDNIVIKEKQVYVNGKKLSEPNAVHHDPYLIPKNRLPRDFFGPYAVPEHSVFVMADNRDKSFDSRFWGPVKKDAIKGKAIVIFWSWDEEAGEIRWGRIGKPIM